MHLIPSWDSFVDTPEFKAVMDKVLKKEVELMDIMRVFSMGMKYGELNRKPAKN